MWSTVNGDEMNTPASTKIHPLTHSGLSERLVAEQLISSAGIAEVGEQARTQGLTLIQELLSGGHVDSASLAAIISEEYGVPLFDLRPMVSEHIPVDLVPQSLIRKHQALPIFRRGNRLFVAIADPTNTSALAEFKFATGIATDSIVVEHQQLSEVIDEVIARYSRTLSTTFAAGVPLVEALDATASASGNAVYTRAIKQIRNDVTSSMSLLQATRASGLFPMFLLQMTSIGEESGTLDEMLGKVADQYEMQVDNAVDSISSLIEPMIMSVLGVLIGGLMIAMYLPIFMLGSEM